MVVALAGRRIDAADAASPRFSPTMASEVRRRICRFLEESGATALACSGACGADLLALDAAGTLGLRRRMVLPFEPDAFRKTSVSDCPGDWGERFDQIYAQLEARGDVVIIRNAGTGTKAYARTNGAILEEALRLAHEETQTDTRVVAVVVWEGAPHGADDLTNEFRERAISLGVPVTEVLTC